MIIIEYTKNYRQHLETKPSLRPTGACLRDSVDFPELRFFVVTVRSLPTLSQRHHGSVHSSLRLFDRKRRQRS